MSAARTIEQELASLEAEALKGGEFVGITNGLALRLVEALRAGRQRIEQQRDATRLSLDDPSLTTYQQDMAAARCWAFGHALELLDDRASLEPPE